MRDYWRVPETVARNRLPCCINDIKEKLTGLL